MRNASPATREEKAEGGTAEASVECGEAAAENGAEGGARPIAFERAVTALASIALAVALVGAGLAACLLPPTTRALSEATSAFDATPYAPEQLTALAQTARDYTADAEPDRGAARATLHAAVAQAARASASPASPTAAQWDALPMALDPAYSRLADAALGENLGAFSDALGFTDDALSHLDDCNRLITVALPVTIVCAALALAALALLHIENSRNPRAALVAARICTAAPALVLAAFAAFGLWALIDFNGLFAAFHGVLFPQGNWTFSSDSLLITMYPLGFWMGMAGIWLAVTASASIICLLFARYLRRSARTRAERPQPQTANRPHPSKEHA